MAELVLVKFIVDTLPYPEGGTAGFQPEKAHALVREGRAVYCDENGKEFFADLEELPAEPEVKAEEVKEVRKAEKEEEKKAPVASVTSGKNLDAKTNKNG